jgi:hypothetical protein
MSSPLDNGVAKDSQEDNSVHKPGPSGVNGGFRSQHTPGRSDNPMVVSAPILFADAVLYSDIASRSARHSYRVIQLLRCRERKKC